MAYKLKDVLQCKIAKRHTYSFDDDFCEKSAANKWHPYFNSPRSYENLTEEPFLTSVENVKISPNLGIVSVAVEFQRSKPPKIESVTPGAVGGVFRHEAEYSAKVDRNTRYLTSVPYVLRFVGKAGLKLSEVVVPAYFAPTSEEIETKSIGYDISKDVGEVAIAEPISYLVSLLDPKTDSEEIKKLKKLAWNSRLNDEKVPDMGIE